MTSRYVVRPPDPWEEPGPHPVTDGVHRIPLPIPGDALRAVNVYALETHEGLVLVDAGWIIVQARDRLEESLDRIGYGLRHVRRVLVTHAHRDHYTLGVALRREFGTHVSVGSGEQPSLAALLAREHRFGGQLALMRRAGADWLAEEFAAAKALDPEDEGWELPDSWLGDEVVAVGERHLRVIATPGHTRGHVVFVDADAGITFAGDHVLPHITPSIGFEAAPAPSPLTDYLDSLRLLRELPDTRMLPAHGPPSPSVHARIDELVAHHDARLAATLDVLRVTGLTPGVGVARLLPWTRQGVPFDGLDSFNQMLAVIETEAHLDLLAGTGRVSRSAGNVPDYWLPDGA